MTALIFQRRKRNRAQQDMLEHVRTYCERHDIDILLPGDVDVENVPVVVLTNPREAVVRRSQAGLTVFDGRLVLPEESDRLYRAKMLTAKGQLAGMLRKVAGGGRIKIVA